MLIINLICADEKSENDGGKDSISAIKDKPRHLDRKQLTAVCKYGVWYS